MKLIRVLITLAAWLASASGFAQVELIERAEALELQGKFTEAATMLTNAFKDASLPVAQRTEVAVDLRQDWPKALREAGFDLLKTETAIVPVICGSTDRGASLAKYCQDRGIFVQAVVAPVVPEGLARLRACVSAAHTVEDIHYCADTIIEGGKALGIIA